MEYNTLPSIYPGLWLSYVMFRRSASCMSTCTILKFFFCGGEVAVLNGTVHVITALYGLMYSTVKPRFAIHWHMKYGDKVPCKSYV